MGGRAGVRSGEGVYNMLRIGVDLDGVVYQWSKTARYMLKNILPDSPYTKDGPLGTESLYWSYIPDNVSKEHWTWLWTEGVRLGLFRHGDMYSGSSKALRELAGLGELVAITHRPESAREDTLAWIAYNRLPFNHIHILTKQESKAGIPACDFYIDDKPENCVELAAFGQVAIPDRPWNQGAVLPTSVVRVFSWGDFISLVKGENR